MKRTREEQHTPKMTAEQAEQIWQAQRALSAFLDANPHMREMQAKYDEWMKKAGNNPQNRLFYFREFMRETLTESRQRLLDRVAELKNECQALLDHGAD